MNTLKFFRSTLVFFICSITVLAPLQTHAFTVNRSLTLGSAGEDVYQLQQTLSELGLLSVAPTGYFGTLTQAAVVEFQKAHGLEPVGSLGPKTRQLLASSEITDKLPGASPLPFVVATSSTAPIKIVVVGASTAAGKNLVEGGYKLSDSWVNRYASYLSNMRPGSSVVNLAVPGSNSYQVLPTGTRNPQGRSTVDTAHNITAALAAKPQAIIVNFPSDANNLTQSEALTNLRIIEATAKAAGIPVFIATPQPIVKGATSVGTALRLSMRTQITQTFGARAIDFWSVLTDSKNNALPGVIMTFDGIHPTAEGHRLIFELVKVTDIPSKVTLSTPPKGTAPTVSLKASTLQVGAGSNVRLSWTSSGASSCRANGWTRITTSSGTKLVRDIQTTRTYDLTCIGNGGSTTVSVTITVVPGAPIVLSYVHGLAVTSLN